MSKARTDNKAENIDEKLATDYLIKAYRGSIAKKIAQGEKGLAGELEKLKRLEQAPAPIENPGPKEEQIGIEDRYRVKRKYTSTDAVRERNIKAGKASAKKHPAKNYRTGKYAKNAITSLRPCKTSCLKYPCDLIEIGKVRPGNACLDVAELVDTYEGFAAAIKENKYDDYKDMVALDLAQMRSVLHRCLQAVQMDTPSLLEEKFDVHGKVIGTSLKSHPLLPEITKMAEKLGITAQQSMITELEIKKNQTQKDGNDTLAEWMSSVGRKMKTEIEDTEDDA